MCERATYLAYKNLSAIRAPADTKKSILDVLAEAALQLSPSKIFKDARPIVEYEAYKRGEPAPHLGQVDWLAVSKLARWLAIIRRDCGIEKLNRAVTFLLSTIK